MSALSPIEKHTLWEDFFFCVRTGESFCFASLLWAKLARCQENCCPGRRYGLWGFSRREIYIFHTRATDLQSYARTLLSATCTREHDTMETWYWTVLITARSEVRISYRREKKSLLVSWASNVLLHYETLQLRLIGVITLPSFLPLPLIFLARAILYLTREGQQSSQMLQSKHTPFSLSPSPSWGGGGGESEQRVEVGGETRGEKGRGSPVWVFVMGRLYSAVSYRESRGEREGGLQLQEQQTHQKNSGATMWMGPKAEVSFIFLHFQSQSIKQNKTKKTVVLQENCILSDLQCYARLNWGEISTLLRQSCQHVNAITKKKCQKEISGLEANSHCTVAQEMCQ